jgi:hypothetical protein
LNDALNLTDEEEHWLHQPILSASATLAEVVAKQDEADDKLLERLRTMSFSTGGIGEDLTPKAVEGTTQ